MRAVRGGWGRPLMVWGAGPLPHLPLPYPTHTRIIADGGWHKGGGGGAALICGGDIVYWIGGWQRQVGGWQTANVSG